VRTAGFEALSARDRRLEEAEQVRLLYVAATRARDHLIASVYHEAKRSGPSTAAGRILLAASDVPQLWQTAAPLDEHMPEAAETVGAALDTPAEREDWLARRAAAIADRTSIPAVSATALARAAREQDLDDPNLQKDAPTEEQPPWRRGRGGTTLGRAVHSVLQTVDLASGADLEATARAQAAAEGIPARAAEVARLARAALDSDAVREAVASGRYWREIYVGAGIAGGEGTVSGDVVVEGFIDLLYETAAGDLVVVDYKTDALSEGDSIEAALERYRLQGAAYALALTEALRRPVARCVFVFVNTAGAIERELPALSEAVEDARARATTQITSR
jgi:ATP-dependent exoDNAse (exonuclease V) beta subunit